MTMAYLDDCSSPAEASLGALAKSVGTDSTPPQFSALVDSVHIEIDRLDKALHVLQQRIAPALSPDETERADKDPGMATAPRSSVIEGLNGIGRHVDDVRRRVEELTGRVDL